MTGLKSLAKDTAIYGLSSIVGRFLNYMLVPLYTAVLPASSGGYGVVSNVYAFTALMLVLLTFGMETGFFRFANKSGEDPMKVYANSLLSVGGVSMIFVLLCLLFLQPIANLLDYGNHPEFIAMMARWWLWILSSAFLSPTYVIRKDRLSLRLLNCFPLSVESA